MKIDVVDLLTIFPFFFNFLKNQSKEQVIEKFYIQDDLHFNEDGNKLIADFFVKNF